MRVIIATCTMVISLGLAGLAISAHRAPNAAESTAEDSGHGCLIDFDAPCSLLR
jgi:hypothetical protein